MTQHEIAQERLVFDQQTYSLDFMLEDTEMDCEQAIQDVIIRELSKSSKQMLQDHSNYDNTQLLVCKT